MVSIRPNNWATASSELSPNKLNTLGCQRFIFVYSQARTIFTSIFKHWHRFLIIMDLQRDTPIQVSQDAGARTRKTS